MTDMDEITQLMNRLAAQEGFNTTFIEGVKIFRASHYTAPEPIYFEQRIIIVGQGRKRLTVGNTQYEYDPDNYLVVSAPLPAECETFAAPDAPFLAMAVDFNPGMLNKIIDKMEPYLDKEYTKPREFGQGIFTARANSQMKRAAVKLLQCLQSPMESSVLGTNAIEELIFRILCGENAPILYTLSMKNTKLAKIDKALKLIQGRYKEPLNVEELSASVNMSPSAFHRTFKKVTAASPIQYIKKIRLDKAREMILSEGFRVNEAANAVGYMSTTQFSREFKRYFGKSPVNYLNSYRTA